MGESVSGAIGFDDPVVILSKPRNVLRLEPMISVRIPAKLCRVLLPLLSDKVVGTQAGLVAPGSHVKLVRKIPGQTAFADVLLGNDHQTLPTARSPGPIAYKDLPPPIKTLVLAFAEKSGGSSGANTASVNGAAGAPAGAPADLDSPAISPESLEYAVVDVPAAPPDDAAVRVEWSKTYWPVGLKLPDKNLRKEVATLTPEETARMKAHMQTVHDMCAPSPSTSGPEHIHRNACVIVDPASDAVVGRGVDTTTQHPLGHAVMNAIDDVAAWQVMRWYPELQESIHRKHSVSKPIETLESSGTDDACSVDPDAQPPYLSTGYDCYTLEEPCAMCAMALVHSRLRRIIYARDAPGGRGMLSSRDRDCPALHACRTLNHHFVVYRLSPRQDASRVNDT